MGPAPKCHFVLGFPSWNPEFPKLGLPQLWRPLTSFVDLRSRWGLKQSCSPRQHLLHNMWQTTCTQINRSNSWFLVVKSQIGSLTPNPSFGHNLCFKYANESCKPILNIYIPRSFQWYKEIFNPMNFSPCNYPLKIIKSIRTPIPKVKVHLGVWRFIPAHFPTLPRVWNVTTALHFCSVRFQLLEMSLWKCTINSSLWKLIIPPSSLRSRWRRQ
jgi:hypothetical protein